jgi:hypothetical protein
MGHDLRFKVDGGTQPQDRSVHVAKVVTCYQFDFLLYSELRRMEVKNQVKGFVYLSVADMYGSKCSMLAH